MDVPPQLQLRFFTARSGFLVVWQRLCSLLVYVIYEHYRKVKLKRVDSLTERKSKSHQTINPVSRSTKSLAP